MPKYDMRGDGFDIDPEQLAHDLTILKLSKSDKLTSNSNEAEYYDAYCKALSEFSDLIADKISSD